ncbi:mannonate dehydratase [Caldalkalibacillus uzonensis]|uniref:mannonate dehydratase n=1 Tax=Caldalkalibacillus uzonensis TaxID=353224 RepID=A0ABU0CSW2_9BACI|nr:mannonate dehydratase [Caldalkalibacillus uzonensis]
MFVTTLCPVFDWTRSHLEYQMPNGLTTLVYEDETIQKMNPLVGDLELPGWDVSYRKDELKVLIDQYQGVSEEDLWHHLQYFLKQIIATADEVGVKMAIHPDDPPWSIFGLPRIITNQANLERLFSLVDSSNHGLTFCTGSLGADPDNNLPEMIRYFGKKGRTHFAYCRNIRITGETNVP